MEKSCIINLIDPIQNNCKYGYVLPDRCRYNSRTGCDCGAYPPIKYEEKTNSKQIRDTNTQATEETKEG